MTTVSVGASQRLAARIAGLAYVLGILYVPIFVLTDLRLIAPGDPAATVANIQANQALFRLGIASTARRRILVQDRHPGGLARAYPGQCLSRSRRGRQRRRDDLASGGDHQRPGQGGHHLHRRHHVERRFRRAVPLGSAA